MNSFPLGGIITLLVLLPNLLFVFFPPKGALPAEENDTRLKIFIVFERIGQATCFILPFFYRIRLEGTEQWAALALMGGFLLVYYWGWGRYLARGRDAAWLFRPLAGIPLPMAVMPVLYFFTAGFLLGSPWLILASGVLAAGHVPVTWGNAKTYEP